MGMHYYQREAPLKVFGLAGCGHVERYNSLKSCGGGESARRESGGGMFGGILRTACKWEGKVREEKGEADCSVMDMCVLCRGMFVYHV